VTGLSGLSSRPEVAPDSLGELLICGLEAPLRKNRQHQGSQHLPRRLGLRLLVSDISYDIAHQTQHQSLGFLIFLNL
jgi:hypothetical protein